jgi:hypothetical protein
VRSFVGQEPIDAIELISFDPTAAAIKGQQIGVNIAEGLANSDLAGFVDNVIERVQVAQDARANAPEAQAADLTQVLGERNVPAEIDKRAVALAAFNKELENEITLLGLSAEEASIQAAIFDAEKKIKGDLTKAEKEYVAEKIRTINALELENQFLNDIKGPEADRIAGTEALNSLLSQQLITQQEYDKSLQELNASTIEYTENQAALAEGLATVWDTGFDALETFLEGGTVAFKDFASQVLRSIADIIAGILRVQALKFLGGAFGLPGFQTGGSFTVGGAGGPDSQLVAFRATPGEQVDVKTPGQAGIDQQQSSQQGAGPKITIVNVTDPNEITEVMNGGEGEQVIINVISRNKNTVRQVVA